MKSKSYISLRANNKLAPLSTSYARPHLNGDLDTKEKWHLEEKKTLQQNNSTTTFTDTKLDI